MILGIIIGVVVGWCICALVSKSEVICGQCGEPMSEENDAVLLRAREYLRLNTGERVDTLTPKP